MLFKKNSPTLLSILSGLLLILAWPTYGFSALLFIAFVPLLLVENSIESFNNLKVFKYAYLTFFIWNVGTTWWIYFSSVGGAIMAIVFNSLFMAMVLVIYHITRSMLGKSTGYLCFVIFWIAFEYLHLTWDLSWPWLTLGNGFAGDIQWIQWYEYTGVLGGSYWVLMSNVLVFSWLQKRSENAPTKWLPLRIAAHIAIPLIISLAMYNAYTEKKNPVSVAVVQPNIDPYKEKFGSMSSSEQLNIFLGLAATVTDSTTEYLVGPETAIPDNFREEELDNYENIKTLRLFHKQYPQLKTILGVSSYKSYKEGEALSSTARKYKDGEGFYDAYNTAVQITGTGPIQLYHKSKLVLGVEMIPYPAFFKYFEKLAIDLGGTTGSLGTQPDRGVFKGPGKTANVAPVICYESIYGEFVTGYVRSGADIIFIITNDGWWDDTPGYKQHLSYASLRAIENRRSIARSANTGTSCFINQRGEITQATPWWKPAAIKGTINANASLTFYSHYGDLIGKLAALLAVLLIPFAVYINLKRKKQNE